MLIKTDESKESSRVEEVSHDHARRMLLDLGVSGSSLNLLDHFAQVMDKEDRALPEGHEIENLEMRVHCMAIAAIGDQKSTEKIHYAREYFYSYFNHPVIEYEAEKQESIGNQVRITDVKAPAAGWIYILKNPSIPGMVKIGMTTKSVDMRIRQLSAPTGVAEPFELVWSCWSEGCKESESMIHKYFKNCRTPGREFFRVDEDEAVAACRFLCGEGGMA